MPLSEIIVIIGTPEEALESCIIIWDELSLETSYDPGRKAWDGDDVKEALFKRLGLPDMKVECPCCEYVGGDRCDVKCPLITLWPKKCTSEDSPYQRWFTFLLIGNLQAALLEAKKIADFSRGELMSLETQTILVERVNIRQLRGQRDYLLKLDGGSNEVKGLTNLLDHMLDVAEGFEV